MKMRTMKCYKLLGTALPVPPSPGASDARSIRLFEAFVLILLLLIAGGCSSKSTSASLEPGSDQPAATNVFDEYLNAGVEPADGFDPPFDQSGIGGWRMISRFAEQTDAGINAGEDWKFSGAVKTSSALNILAAANGRVVFAGRAGERFGNTVIIEHVFYENHEKRKIRSVYARLDQIKIARGDEARRSQPVATVEQSSPFHFELRSDASLAPAYWPSSEARDRSWIERRYADPSAFINTHRKLFAPQREATLILVDQSSYQMRLYQNRRLTGEYAVSFGQGKGQKRVQGDNKTPKGMYFVIGKHRGKFDGAYGGYYGGHWIKINYPNRFDAAWGRAQGIVTPQQEAAISANWEKRAATLENTRLGGGIGFHGWIREWDDDGPRHLSWGCVVMHIRDISKLYDQIPEGSMAVIF